MAQSASPASAPMPAPATAPSLSSQASSQLASSVAGQILSVVNSNLSQDSSTTTTAATAVPSPGPSRTTVSTVSDISTSSTTFPNSTLTASTVSSVISSTGQPLNDTLNSHPLPHDDMGQDLVHSFMFQTVLLLSLVAMLIALVYIVRKKHLDRLRHHLMPVYNFDPADDGEDWETELLDDQFVHSPPTDAAQTLNSGQLAMKLDTGLTRGLRVQNNNSAAASAAPVKSNSNCVSPTAMSGLLSANSDSGSNLRRMYTNERDPVA